MINMSSTTTMNARTVGMRVTDEVTILVINSLTPLELLSRFEDKVLGIRGRCVRMHNAAVFYRMHPLNLTTFEHLSRCSIQLFFC